MHSQVCLQGAGRRYDPEVRPCDFVFNLYLTGGEGGPCDFVSNLYLTGGGGVVAANSKVIFFT